MQDMPNGLLFCLASLLLCASAARRSIGAGIGAVLAIGYFYGIIRANYLDGFSHFAFDAGLIGFYFVRFNMPVSDRAEAASRSTKNWLILLLGWPLVLFFLPINHIFIQLVGLRHIVLFLPFMLIGARTSSKDLNTIAMTIAVLNVICFGFAIVEYYNGIVPFFPRNSVTEIMYHSTDVKTATGRFYRLPSTFTSSHAFGGNMLLTLPFLLNSVLNPSSAISKRLLMAGATVLTVLSIFIAGPRLPVVQLFGFITLMLLLPGLKPSVRLTLASCILVIGLISAFYVNSNERFQRFKTLNNTELVESRATQSLGFSLQDSLLQYPLGVGLGGVVGSSLPFFLKTYAPTYFGAENEFVRIAAEQGIIGFMIWIILIFKILSRRPTAITPKWEIGTHAMWAMLIVCWATAFIGTGMLQGIPNSVLMLLQMGIILRRPSQDTLLSPTTPARVTLMERFRKLESNEKNAVFESAGSNLP